jgi:tetratricopeptide (TPR) repeat protein
MGAAAVTPMGGRAFLRTGPSPSPTRGPSRRRRDHRAVTLSRRLLAASVLGAGMGLGGLHWITLLPCAALAVAAGIFAAGGICMRPAGYVPVLGLLLLAAYTAFQALPLPLAWVHGLSAPNGDMWTTALSPFGEPSPRWATLSADPGATLVEALKWLMYAGLMGASILVGSRRGVTWGASALFLCACAVGGTTLVHGLLDLDRVYGFYTPSFSPSRWRVGPLLNSNNVAGYLNLGMLSALGLMVSRRPPFSRLLIGFGVATLLPLVVMSGSRAGFVALVCGLLTFGALLVFVGGKSRSWKVLAPIGAAVAGAAILAWLGTTRETSRELLDKNVEKLEVFPHVTRLIRDYPWFGIGRGAFESVFPAYHVGQANVVYAYAENFPLEWVAEWGVPVGGLALVALGWMLRGARRGLDGSGSGAGIFAGLVALLLQNLLDLGLEVPGVFAAATLGVGVLWGHAHRHDLEAKSDSAGAPLNRTHPTRPTLWMAAFQAGAAAAMLALGALVIAFGRHGVTEDRRQVGELFAHVDYREKTRLSTLRDTLHEAMKRHPAEPYFPRIGAHVARVARDQEPIPWIQRALERGMSIGPTHFELGSILVAAGARRQALFEFRLAAEYESALVFPSAQVVADLARNFDEVTLGVPDGVPGARTYWEVAARLRGPAWGELKLRCLEAGLSRDPDVIGIRVNLADALIGAMTSGGTESVCVGERLTECQRVFDAHVVALGKLDPDAPTALVLKARLWLATGNAAAAERLLRQGCASYTEAARSSCDRAHVEAAIATRSVEVFRAAAQELAVSACGGGACAEVLAFLGGGAEGLGDLGDALAYYQKAAAEAPTDGNLTNVARIATALGEHRLASIILGRLARSHPDDSGIQQRLNDETLRLMLRAQKP